MDRQRVGGSDTNPIYRIQEVAGAQLRDKYVVSDTGVAFDTLEAAQAAAQELDALTPPSEE